MTTLHRQLRHLLPALLLLPLSLAVEAQAAPSAPGRGPDQRERVAMLQRQLLALTALETVTVQSLTDALNARVGPPVQVTPYRREWPLLPSTLIAEGQIVQAGTDLVYVEVVPAQALNLSFEDLAIVLAKLPYYLESRSGHVGVDSVASRIYAIDHRFRGKAGILDVQIPTRLPDDTPDREVKAIREGYAVASGATSRDVRVASIQFRTPGQVGWPDGRTRTLDEFRKLKRATKKR
jgi:hypothetical protein